MPKLRQHFPKVPSMPETLTMRIKGYSFQLTAPYEPGQPLGQAEAALLNREWVSRIRAAYLPQVAACCAEHYGKLTEEQLACLQEGMSAFGAQFAFKAQASPRATDPLSRQKHAIAKRILDMRLNAQGITRESYGGHRYEAMLAKLMALPDVIAQAQANLDATRDAADMLAGMGET